MVEKISDWVHRKTVISGKSCFKRNCKEFHGMSPSLQVKFNLQKAFNK